MRVAWLALLLACEPGVGPAAVDVQALDGVALAALADRIDAAPSDADAILRGASLDRAGFEALLYEVASDPVQARAFREARRR